MSKNSTINASVESKKRLLRDLKEIHEHPLENVTAAPVADSNMFIWHANLRGVDSEMKGVFHFILEFPTTYPLNPPNVTLCTPLPHPNVFPHKTIKGAYSLCMDMLEQGAWSEDIDKNVQYSGWSSSYTVQLVLVQLQAFLLDAQLQYATQKGTLADALAKAASFSCPSCSHKAASPFPPFATSQQLAARTCVKVRKFVPRPRASHLYPPVLRVPIKRTTSATPATVTPASATTKKDTTPKSTPSTTPAPSTTPSAKVTTFTSTTNTTAPSPIPVREWTTVSYRRLPIASSSSSSSKKTKKTNNTKPATPVNAKAKVQDKPAKAKKAAPVPEPIPSPKKAKKVDSSDSYDASPVAYAAANEAPHKKDYVKLMLQDAAEREQMLLERSLRDKEELKKERKRLNKKNKKLAKAAPTASPSAPAPKSEEIKEEPVAKKSNGKAKRKAKKAAAEVAAPQEETVEEKKEEVKAPVKETKTSWADEYEEEQAAITPTPTPAPETPSLPQASTKKQKKEEPSAFTYKQLSEKVSIDHRKLGSLSEFPLDILLHAFSFLPTSQISALSSVSVDMNKVAENGVLWRELFSKHYPKSKLTASNIADWKFVFMREVDHIMDELVCFHTKHTFEEDVLGIPINFTVNPKTEKVDYISSTLDIISSTAFTKHGIRKSPFKQPFTHFLPLYITEEHFQKALPEIKKLLVALSPEFRTTGFHPHMVLSAIPKLMNTMIVLVMDGGLSASVKALHGYFAFHRLLLAFIEMYPELMVEVNNRITSFLQNEENRTKSAIPSIGDWFPLVSVSNKYTWAHVAKYVVAEVFDRNVIWICKEDPTLATLADISKTNANNNNGVVSKPGVEQHRLDKSFQASNVSLKLVLFHVYFLTRIARPAGVSLAQVADNYDRYFGRPNSKTTDSFQLAVKKIQGMRGWPDFFLLVGLPCPTPAGLTTILRDSVRNSKKKKYHNDSTNFRNIQASGTSVILKKGDNFSAPSSLEKVVMGLGWGYKDGVKYLDASCFELKRNGEFLGVVDFARRSNSNSSVVHSGDVIDGEKKSVEHTINITLSKLRAETEVLMFTITAYSEDLRIGLLPWVRLSDGASNQELCRYVLENTGTHTAVMMCMMTKNAIKKCWDLKVLAKLDEGRATGYTPLQANMSAFLKSGAPFQ